MGYEYEDGQCSLSAHFVMNLKPLFLAVLFTFGEIKSMQIALL
jgi:hypothetical protein